MRSDTSDTCPGENTHASHQTVSLAIIRLYIPPHTNVCARGSSARPPHERPSGNGRRRESTFFETLQGLLSKLSQSTFERAAGRVRRRRDTGALPPHRLRLARLAAPDAPHGGCAGHQRQKRARRFARHASRRGLPARWTRPRTACRRICRGSSRGSGKCIQDYPAGTRLVHISDGRILFL